VRTKFRSVIDDDLLNELKALAADQKRGLNDLLEEALRYYLRQIGRAPNCSAVERTWGRIAATQEQIKTVLEEDPYGP
jgi:hypothetical protein